MRLKCECGGRLVKFRQIGVKYICACLNCGAKKIKEISVADVKVQFKRLYDDAILPTRAHNTDACMDLYAHSFWVYSYDKLRRLDGDNYFLRPGDSVLVKVGFSMSLPDGWEAQVRPRSGLALKNKVTVLNSPGTIDCEFKGEVGVILVNHTAKGVVGSYVKKGDRVAQMAIARVPVVDVEVVDELGDSDRGTGGFGSSGS